MADFYDRKFGKDKTDPMLWLDLNKILEILIRDENMLTSIQDPTFKVSNTGKMSQNPGVEKIWVFPSISHELGKNVPIHWEIYGN